MKSIAAFVAAAFAAAELTNGLPFHDAEEEEEVQKV